MSMTLSQSQIAAFKRDGYVAPLAVLTPHQLAILRDAIREHLRREIKSDLYELTDPISIVNAAGPGEKPDYRYSDSGGEPAPSTFPFLFNLWRKDRRFLEIGTSEIFAEIARQLLAVDEVLLFEDNVIIKAPYSKYLPWHQDYSYWPLGESSALTFWIALDDVDASNGAMELAPGTQRLGERLPVAFGDEQPFMADERPGIAAVPRDPKQLGFETTTYRLRPGECGVHDAMVWHGSTANTTGVARHVLVLRYVAAGTLWLGPTRMAYDDLGCAPGDLLTTEHLPLAGERRTSAKTLRSS